ncbi:MULTISPECIES: putative phage abortive infection protein [unclassified Variovorax]|uniref:putative phage abortive infection protein n=1 Tax=unclassified Variovorax TaxID=663243 RepID=UPI003F483797
MRNLKVKESLGKDFPWFPVLVCTLIICVVLIWGASWFYAEHYVKSSDTKLLTDEGARGVFGDQFGAVNALFSGLAFTGVIITLLLQRNEIKRQSASLQRQQFEVGFFQLMSMHSALVDQLDIGGSKGRLAFERFLRTMQIKSTQMDVFELVKPLDRADIGGLAASGVLTEGVKLKLDASAIVALEEKLKEPQGRSYMSQYMDENLTEHREIIERAYKLAHIDTKDALSHYFRTLFHVLRYVDDSALISSKEKERYAKLIGAQLSGLELVVIFYNSLMRPTKFGGNQFGFGFPDMFKLLKKYDLMKHLNENILFHPIHKRVFDGLTGGEGNV